MKLCNSIVFPSPIADPRTKGWFLMSSPLPTLMICLSYVYIVKVLGPRLMANRKPFELRRTLIVYNLFQVIFSTWLFYEVTRTIYNLALGTSCYSFIKVVVIVVIVIVLVVVVVLVVVTYRNQ